MRVAILAMPTSFGIGRIFQHVSSFHPIPSKFLARARGTSFAQQ
jgi:hypothetical protein